MLTCCPFPAFITKSKAKKFTCGTFESCAHIVMFTKVKRAGSPKAKLKNSHIVTPSNAMHAYIVK